MLQGEDEDEDEEGEMDIRKIYAYALQREREGKRFFEQNAERLSHAAAAGAFRRLAAEEQQVAEPLGGDERGARQPALEQRVGGDRRAVHEVRHIPGRDARALHIIGGPTETHDFRIARRIFADLDVEIAP